MKRILIGVVLVAGAVSCVAASVLTVMCFTKIAEYFKGYLDNSEKIPGEDCRDCE